MKMQKLEFSPGWYIGIDRWTFTFTRGKHKLSWRIVIIHHFRDDDKRYIVYFTPWRR